MRGYSTRDSLRAGTAALALAAFAMPVAAHAQQRTHDFAIPSQDLGTALKALALASGEQVIFKATSVRGRRSAALAGRHSVDAGLAIMLRGTGLAGSRSPRGILVVQAASPSRARVSAAAPEQARIEAGAPVADDADIVVTATRRSASLLDVPLSVAAYDQQKMDQKGLRSVDDIARMTPGVSMGVGFGIKTIAIRGVASTVGAATTGIYIDETPVQVRALSVATNFYPAIFDLDRVEVLRGPQGTLFGAGAMGGAVRFILAQPGLTRYSGSARAELAFTEGGDPSYEAGGAIGGPIVADRIGFRVSGYHRRDGGYVDRIPIVADRGTAEKNSNSRETTVLNAALTFAPSETFKITPSIFYQKSDRDDLEEYWVIQENPLVPRPPLRRFVNGDGLASYGRDKALIYALKGEWDLGAVTLISNTAYLDRTSYAFSDASAAYMDLLGGGLFDLSLGGTERASTRLRLTQRALTQELRLQSNPDADSRLSYAFGLFFQNSRQAVLNYNFFPEVEAWSTALYGFPIFGAALPDGSISRDLDRSRDRQYAAFGEVEYKLTDRLTATAGVRVSRVKFDFWHEHGGPFYSNIDGSNSGTTSETPVTPKFALRYEPGANWMVYASASKGFRPGGANPVANPTLCAGDLADLGLGAAPLTYRSDSVWSYEVGAKGRVGRSVSIAASAFTIDWNNIQRARVLPTCGHTFLDNLGSARSRGFDIQLTVSPLEGMTLDAGIGYMDAISRETLLLRPGATPADPRTLTRKGDRFAVPWIVTLGAAYEAALGAGGPTGYAHVQYDFRSSFTERPGNVGYNPNIARVDDQHFVTARLGVRRGPIDLSLFVNNLFNSRDSLGRYQLSAVSDRILETSFRPRTIGATAAYRF